MARTKLQTMAAMEKQSIKEKTPADNMKKVKIVIPPLPTTKKVMKKTKDAQENLKKAKKFDAQKLAMKAKKFEEEHEKAKKKQAERRFEEEDEKVKKKQAERRYVQEICDCLHHLQNLRRNLRNLRNLQSEPA